MKEVRISCFGALRDLSPDGTIRVKAELPCTAGSLKETAMEQFSAPGASIIFSSAISQGHKILRNTDLIDTDEELCLLPPVNGG